MQEKNPIDELFRKADASPASDFPAGENVWARLEERLENRQLKKSKKTWKKVAVAASVLLCASIGFQLWQQEEAELDQKKEEQFYQPSVPANKAPIKPDAVQDSPADESVSEESLDRKAIGNSSEAHTDAAPETVPPAAEKVQQREPVSFMGNLQGKSFKQMPAAKMESLAKPSVSGYVETEAEKDKDDDLYENFNSGRRQPAARMTADFVSDDSKTQEVAKKKEPLYIVLDKPVTGRNDAEYRNRKREALMAARDMDSIVVLPDPLYIINGTEYSEESLFGEKPTSPYAPLQSQQIEEIRIIKEDEAVKQFGTKGKKGVVIIRTKDGKPAPKQ